MTLDLNIHRELAKFQLAAIRLLARDAADLPKIENAATAVANNQSITADTAIYLHDGQYNFGGFIDWDGASRRGDSAGIVGALAADAAFDEFSDNNLHTAAAFALTLAAAGGIIETC